MTHTCRYAWVRTWHSCGFEECRECGRTRAYGKRPETFEEAAQAVASEHSEALGLLAAVDTAHVPPTAWNAVGWHECYCCGETRGGLDGPAPVESSPPPATAGAPSSCEVGALEPVAPPSPQPSTAEPARYGDATPRKPRPPRAPVGTRPHGGQNRKADRDREVLAMLAAKVPGKEIATHFGLTESRISQIKKAAAAAAAQGAV